MLTDKRVLLIIGGGIAAYKSLQLIRLLRSAGANVTPVLTRAGSEFVTALSVAALAEQKVHEALFDLTQEAEMGHIALSRAADLVVIAPATADLIAKMATGRADDLASTLALATDKRILLAPAMNVRMWLHPATQRNLATLAADGVLRVGPNEGEMACGEYGPGRMAEPQEIFDRIGALLGSPAPAGSAPLAGKHVIVTSGPTHEPIDPVRYIANRSSGAQGTAIAAALRELGARVSFITGPAEVPPPQGVHVVAVQTAEQMRQAVHSALPADAAVMAAAVADWRVVNAGAQKIKKDAAGTPPMLQLAQTADILAEISMGQMRPQLVVGFAAETEHLQKHGLAKLQRKGCDWILANDVSPQTGIMGGTHNEVVLITKDGAEAWPRMDKAAVARRLAAQIAAALAP